MRVGLSMIISRYFSPKNQLSSENFHAWHQSTAFRQTCLSDLYQRPWRLKILLHPDVLPTRQGGRLCAHHSRRHPDQPRWRINAEAHAHPLGWPPSRPSSNLLNYAFSVPPCFFNNSSIALCPSRFASASGVPPHLSFGLMSTFFSIKNSTALMCPSDAATWMPVRIS